MGWSKKRVDKLDSLRIYWKNKRTAAKLKDRRREKRRNKIL